MKRLLHTLFVGAVILAMTRAVPAPDQARGFAVLALLFAADAAWRVRRLEGSRS